LVGAYNELRNREAMRLYKRKYTDLEEEYNNPETKDKLSEDQIEILKGKVKKIQDLFPQKLSEAETESN